MVPLQIKEFSDTSLFIIWEDDHNSIYLYEDLRNSCPCARCNEIRRSAQKGIPFKRTIPIDTGITDVKPTSIEAVGNYALRFYWSDRHSTGIYTFKLLRDLCPCDECTGNVPA